jgi:hypothetical protein
MSVVQMIPAVANVLPSGQMKPNDAEQTPMNIELDRYSPTSCKLIGWPRSLNRHAQAIDQERSRRPVPNSLAPAARESTPRGHLRLLGPILLALATANTLNAPVPYLYSSTRYRLPPG